MTNSSNDPLLGRTVAHYEILARLGGGGMGVVYKARDTRLGRTVALKFLPPQWSHDEDAKQRFVREAQAASATDHRNICTIHDIAATPDGQLFIVMAYYDGPTLKQRLERGPLSIDEALDIATQVADGLARAHGQGVVHRDVKPGNLILAEDGVRIVDFGLATFADALQLTVAGSTLGTAPYMSPEQVKGEAADASTDVWAAGVILYQMLAGHVPFRGSHHEAIAHAIRNETPWSIRAARPEVPEEVEQLVFRALHKEKAIRYPTGRELARALRQVRGQTMPLDLRTEPVIAPEGARLAVRRRRPRWPWWAAAAAVLLALGGGVGWVMTPPNRPGIVILPVSNQTGDSELAPYQRALTLAMIEALSPSPVVRPVPWTRTLQSLRGFEGELSSIAAMAAVGGVQGSAAIAVPTLVYEDERWRLRIDIRDKASESTVATYLTDARVSALKKETAYALALDGVGLIEKHFGANNPRLWFHDGGVTRIVASLDAMRAFEEGVRLFDEQEYAPAHAAFTDAARLDPSSAAIEIWRSRAALAMRDRSGAAAAATAAERLVGSHSPPGIRLLAAATVAEARGEFAAAARHWIELMKAVPDEPGWVLELALLDDRRADTREGWSAAVARYREALLRDPTVIRPHLELCRLYNRLQEPPNAMKEGSLARDAYRAAGWRGGEALAMLCLSDALRSGQAGDIAKAATLARQAGQTLRESGLRYNRPRAVYYEGLAVAEQGDLTAAVSLWEQALTEAEQAGNRPLQPIILNNLGVSSNRLGRPEQAREQFRRSAALYEAIGEQRRAARQQYNSASLQVNYGVNDEFVLRELNNALEVAERQGDHDFVAAGLVTRAQYFRNLGRFDDSKREASRAEELAIKHGLAPRQAAAALEHGRRHLLQSDYGAAIAAVEGIGTGSERSAIAAALIRGRATTRLGDLAAARAHLDAALRALDSRDDTGLRPMLHTMRGELEYQAGNLVAARREFDRVARLWNDRFTEEAVVEARGYLGLIDVLQGRVAEGLARLESSVAHAQATRRVSLEARLRVLWAAACVTANRRAEALRILDRVPGEALVMGEDWRAQFHYWRSRASVDGRAAQMERDQARNALKKFAAAVPEGFRSTVTSRSDLRPI